MNRMVKRFDEIKERIDRSYKGETDMMSNNITYLEKYKKDHVSPEKKYVRDRVARADSMLESLSSLQETLKKSKEKKKNVTKKAKPSKPTEKPPKKDTPHANEAKESEDSNTPEFSFVGDPSSTASGPAGAMAPANSEAITGASVKEEGEYITEKMLDDSRFDILKKQFAECKQACAILEKELKDYEIFQEKKKIEGITLKTSDKLIDFLIQRILDVDINWKNKIDLLINVSHSLPGDYLRAGDYFEALFQLAIVIGILPFFSGKYVKMFDIGEKYNELNEKNNYLYEKSIKNSGGNEQGISDITFKVSSDPAFETNSNSGHKCGEKPMKVISDIPLYFISVKGYKKEKSVKDGYDIPLLNQQINQFPEEKNKQIMVCVRNKEQFLSRLSRTKIEFLKGYPVIGYDEVIDAFSVFRVNFFNKFSDKPSPEQIERKIKELFPENIIQKPMLSLYYHQQLIVKACIDRIKDGEKDISRPHYLCIGVLPRGGKSYIAGGLINEHMSHKSKKTGYNILFLTSAVTETRTQFREDLIQKFGDFANFNFIDVVISDKEKELDVSGEAVEDKNNFYFISRQLSQKKQVNPDDTSIVASADILSSLTKKLGKVPSFDVCFFDEAHIGIISTSVRENFDKVFAKFPGIPIVLMTATYKAPAAVLNSPKDLFVWDLQDIKDMKLLPTIGLEGFNEKIPDFYVRYHEIAKGLLEKRLQNGETLGQIAKPYIQFPNPNFINLTFAPETVHRLIESKGGYSYEKAFIINKDDELLKDYSRWTDWQSLVQNKEQAINLRTFLTPEQDKHDMILVGDERKYRALNQIFNITQKNGSRPSPIKPFSILMFLPMLNEQNVGQLCRVWASFLLQAPYWRNNFVALVLSPTKFKKRTSERLDTYVKNGLVLRDNFPGKDLKQLIMEVEAKALELNKGLLLLSGDVAKMGISLPCVDIVCLMSNNSDADDIIQKMYRALNEYPPNKKDGFIVDLDLKRIVTAFFEYDLNKDKMRWSSFSAATVDERLLKIGELCNWGYDAFIEDNTSMNFNYVMSAIKTRVFDDIRLRAFEEGSESKLEKNQKELIESDLQLRNELISALVETKFNRRTKKPSEAEILLLKGQTIPDEKRKNNGNDASNNNKTPNKTPNETPNETAEHKGETEKPPFVPDPDFMKQIYIKAFQITKTFVNALVIKSAQPIDKSINIQALLTNYQSNKKSSKGEVLCSCESIDDCVKTHDNMYDTVFCELKSYAMKQKGDRYIYDFEIHNMILNSVDKIFTKSPNIIEWNIYIEKFLSEIKSGKSLSKRLPEATAYSEEESENTVTKPPKKPSTRKKCPNGTHRNKKTGECKPKKGGGLLNFFTVTRRNGRRQSKNTR